LPEKRQKDRIKRKRIKFLTC